MKKMLNVVAAFALAATMLLTSCGGSKNGGKKTVGVAMPTQSSERWINDGANMKKQLEAVQRFMHSFEKDR